MDRFEEKQAIKGAVAAALELLRKHKRGDVVPWAAIEGAAGFERYTRHWAAFLKRTRRDFMGETGICLWPVTDVGMELLTTQDQLITRSAKRRRKALRQMRRDVKELAAIPDADLTSRQKVLRANQVAAGREGARQVNRQLRLTQILAKPSSSGQPRPVMATAAAKSA